VQNSVLCYLKVLVDRFPLLGGFEKKILSVFLSYSLLE
jgi:hypothetical protein